MSFFCDAGGLRSLVSSQPTIPLILRGKKKVSQKPVQQKVQTNIIRQPTTDKPVVHQSPIKIRVQPIEIKSNMRINAPPTIVVQRPIISHVRSISLPRSPVFHQVPTHVVPVHGQKIIQVNRSTTTQNRRKVSAPSESIEGQNIRKCLDENLHVVYKDLHERRQSMNLPNMTSMKSQMHRPKLEQKLVQQYIKLIYRDYSIPDPLQKYSPFKQSTQVGNENRSPSIEHSIATQPNRGINSSAKRRGEGSTSKKAVQLKQSFLVEMFSPKEILESNSHHRYRGQSSGYSGQRDPNSMNLPSGFLQDNLEEISQAAEREIKQTYRYCFICQQPILQANISIHERDRCPQFCNLYSMNLEQLRQALIRKILRIRRQTQQIHSYLFSENTQNLQVRLSSLKAQGERYLSTIDTNIKVSQFGKSNSVQLWKDAVKDNFTNVMECYEEDYFKLYQNFRKLQWFVIMLKNLEERYCLDLPHGRDGTEGSFSKEIGDGRNRRNTRETQVFQSRRLSLAR